ncbi:MAG: hypothetical protein RSB75_04255, partial [Anaerovoracaceae bacterium]
MMNTKKRWLAALLSVVMVVAMLPSMAFAAVGDGLAPKNVKVEDKTGVVTWDQVIAKDGAYKAESGDYVVQLQSKLKASVNAQDWTEVTSGIKTAAAANLDTSIKTMSAVIDYSKLADLDAAKYEFRISVAYDGEATTAAVTKQATDATKAQAVTRDTVKLEQDGKTGELVANFTAASANVVPTGYKVNLYKNKDLLVKEPTAVPSTATLVKTVEAKAVTAGMEARFPA